MISMPGELFNINPNALNPTIEFLTAMVTPALLISATGSLVLSTSTRLGRVVDRVRQLEERLSDLIYLEDKDDVPLYDKRVEVIVDLLGLPILSLKKTNPPAFAFRSGRLSAISK